MAIEKRGQEKKFHLPNATTKGEKKCHPYCLKYQLENVSVLHLFQDENEKDRKEHALLFESRGITSNC